jgi:hypothetical protein
VVVQTVANAFGLNWNRDDLVLASGGI